jgi:hypothetical protein
MRPEIVNDPTQQMTVRDYLEAIVAVAFWISLLCWAILALLGDSAT